MSNSCPICLEPILSPTRVSSCNHLFHFECIQTWSKINNTCPLCKAKFCQISTSDGFREFVEDREQRISDTELDFMEDVGSSTCEVCGSGHDEANLLVCDGCDEGYHLFCLNP
eukprot:325847_1